MAQNQSNSLRSNALTNVGSGYRPLNLSLSGASPLTKPSTSSNFLNSVGSALGSIFKTPSYVNTTSLTGAKSSSPTIPFTSPVVMPKGMNPTVPVKTNGGASGSFSSPTNPTSVNPTIPNTQIPQNYGVNTNPTNINSNQPSVYGQGLTNVYNAENPPGGIRLPDGDIAAAGTVQGDQGTGQTYNGAIITQRNGLLGTLDSAGNFTPFNQNSTSDTTSQTSGNQSTTNPDTLANLQNGNIQSQLIGRGIESNLQAQDLAKSAGLLTQRIAQETGNVMNDPNYSSSVRIGQAGNINTQEGAKLNALAAQQAALTGQGNTFLSGANSVAPVMQFGQLTNPLTGAPINGGQYGSNPQLQSAVSQAVQLVQNGASPNDPQVQSLLSTFGLPGASLFNQALSSISNGSYNPTTSAATASQTAGQAASYKGQAVDLNASLQNLDNASSQAQNFLNAVQEINPGDSAILNKPVNTYIGSIKDPAAMTQYNAILGDIKKFTSSILASNNGTIPSDVTNTLASFDPSTLSASQLPYYLNTLKQLGGNQLAVLQRTYSQLGGTGYIGSPTSVNTQANPAPNSTSAAAGLNNPIAQGLAGGLLNVLPTALNSITNFLGGLGGEITGAVTAANLFK